VSEISRRGWTVGGQFFPYVFALDSIDIERLTDEQARELFDALDDATEKVLNRFATKHGVEF